MTQYRFSDYYHVKEILNMYRVDDDQERSVIIIENGVGGNINHILETRDCFLFGSGPMLDSDDTEQEALFQIVIDSEGNIVGKNYKNRPFMRSQQKMIRRLLRNPSITHFIGQRLLVNAPDLSFYNFEPYVEPEEDAYGA